MSKWLVLALALLGCGRDGSSAAPTAEYDYALRFAGPEAPLHGVLMMGDVELGRSRPAKAQGGSQWDREYGTINVRLPRATLLAEHQDDLALVVSTACASTRVPMRITPGVSAFRKQGSDWAWSAAYELERRAGIDRLPADRRHTSQIEAPIDWAGELPASMATAPVTIYVDRHQPEDTPSAQQQEITIGALVVPRGTPSFTTDGLGCADRFDIKVDGVVVGELVTAERARAYVISTEPACYVMRQVRYATAKSKPQPTSPAMHLGPGVAFPLTFEPIGHFLREAPSSSRGPGSTSELLAEPCPPGQ